MPAELWMRPLAGAQGTETPADGRGTTALFSQPTGLVFDDAGNLYVADTGNGAIRKITPLGVVTTIAGSGALVDSVETTGEQAGFVKPTSMVRGPDGFIYFVDAAAASILKLSPDGAVSTLLGYDHGAYPDRDGTPLTMKHPRGLAFDAAGNLMVADVALNVIWKVTPEGEASIFAGEPGAPGSANGPRLDARFYGPSGLASDRLGNLFVADTLNDTIRKISPDGLVSVLAGKASIMGSLDGDRAVALFTSPVGLVFDLSGDLLVWGQSSHQVRRVSPAGVVSTDMGIDRDLERFVTIRPDGTSVPDSIQWIAIGRDGTRGIAYRHAIRVVSRNEPPRFVGVLDQAGYQDGSASGAHFGPVRGLTVDPAGVIFVLEGWTDSRKKAQKDCILRRVGSDGTVTTIALADKMALVQSSIIRKVTEENERTGKKAPNGKKFQAKKLAERAAQATFVGISTGLDGRLLLAGTDDQIYSYDLSGDIEPAAEATCKGKLAASRAGGIYCQNGNEITMALPDGRTSSIHEFDARPSDIAAAANGNLLVAVEGGLEELSPDGSARTRVKRGSSLWKVAVAPDGAVYAIVGASICHLNEAGVLTPLKIRDNRLSRSSYPATEFTISRQGTFIILEEGVLYTLVPSGG